MISGWKEKELLFKPIDIFNKIFLTSQSQRQRKSQANIVGKEGADGSTQHLSNSNSSRDDFSFRQVHLEIILIHYIVLHQGLYQNLKEIILNTHVQDFLDLFSQNLQRTAYTFFLNNFSQVIAVHQHNLVRISAATAPVSSLTHRANSFYYLRIWKKRKV